VLPIVYFDVRKCDPHLVGEPGGEGGGAAEPKKGNASKEGFPLMVYSINIVLLEKTI